MLCAVEERPRVSVPVVIVSTTRQGGCTCENISGFRFGRLTGVYGIDFMPGAAKYHDLPGLLAISAPTRLWVSGEIKASISVAEASYAAAGEPDRLIVSHDPPAPAAVVSRLLDRP